MDAALTHWLRVLWNITPPLHMDSPAPFIADSAIHLPARVRWQHHCAAAAHAAAHLVYSPSGFDGSGLGPLARSLLALLEDARVEALAVRELPGLARLWRPLHDATPADGDSCAALMQRLARALADPSYDDPHPWIRKGRRLFFLDETLALPALRNPAELRTAALRLGHDIGQMRLGFDAKGYRPAPSYRDDHRWMWSADQLSAVAPAPGHQPDAPPPSGSPDAAQTQPDDEPPDVRGGGHTSRDPTPDDAATGRRYPEWDRLIGRLRPDWTRVIERDDAAPAAPALPGASDASNAAGAASAADSATPTDRLLPGALRALIRNASSRSRSDEGERFVPDALIDWRLSLLLRSQADTRVYRAAQQRVAHTAVVLLIDQSASTADTHADTSILRRQTRAAFVTARALQALGVRCAAAAFSSDGRNAVRLRWLKHFAQPADDGLDRRLQRLGSGGSTRLGAALRHASARLGAVRADGRWILLFSDAQPHDVDVHDPRYLVEDARHAVRAAARRAVRIACVRIAQDASDGAALARRIFGARGVQDLQDAQALPRTLAKLLA